MDLALPAPPVEKSAPVTTVQVAAATDPYTAPVIQVWRTVRPDQTSPATAQASAAPGRQPAAASNPATAPTLQPWRSAGQEPAQAAPPATTAAAQCGRHTLPLMAPATAPTVQVWYTVTPQAASTAEATPCSSNTPTGVTEGPASELSARALKLNAANRQRWAPAIQQVAVTYHLEPALLHAVISAESGYNPEARSPKGARGLMQLMPDTARRFGVSDAADPTANLQGGARYLRWLLDLFTDLRLALAGYNAGENTVIRYGNTIPPYPETQTYVRRVLDYYRHYRSPVGW